MGTFRGFSLWSPGVWSLKALKAHRLRTQTKDFLSGMVSTGSNFGTVSIGLNSGTGYTGLKDLDSKAHFEGSKQLTIIWDVFFSIA